MSSMKQRLEHDIVTIYTIIIDIIEICNKTKVLILTDI
jgi:hypothetical protein